MGRDKANKLRRPRGRVLPAGSEDRSMTAEQWAQAVGHARQTPVAGLTLFRSEALGLGDVVVDDGSGVDFTELAVPTVLIEPQRSLMMKPRDGGLSVDGQVEAAVHAGMSRITAAGAVVRPAADWGLHLSSDGWMELQLTKEPHTIPWSRLQGAAGPQWLSVARDLGWVLCLYGPHLGVAPPGGPAQTYTDKERLAEIEGARTIGWLAGALVGFHAAEEEV
ncbi:hypothetical protein ACEZDB_36020 [Streptacidiphilus sp. N1-3]|uniref:Uncharacterized protein n=1 Tax=Streptacidiphilus alkalitolerans TaxID=3342712 RepID=A0ABV6XCN9_9ACTN